MVEKSAVATISEHEQAKAQLIEHAEEEEDEFQDCLDEVQFAKQFSDENPATAYEDGDSESSDAPNQELKGNEEKKDDAA